MNRGDFDSVDDKVTKRGVLRVLVVHEPGSPATPVSAALIKHPRLHVIGERPCDGAALAAIDALTPDVVVLDASIKSNPTGFRLAMSIKSALPSTGMVILVRAEELAAISITPKRQSPRCSFLFKDSVSDASAFSKVVEGAADGHIAIDPLIVKALQSPYRHLLERLTADQQIALELLAAGYSDRVIAQKLGMDDRETVKMVESVYADLHIPEDPSIHRRVKAALVFLSEMSSLRS